MTQRRWLAATSAHFWRIQTCIYSSFLSVRDSALQQMMHTEIPRFWRRHIPALATATCGETPGTCFNLPHESTLSSGSASWCGAGALSGASCACRFSSGLRLSTLRVSCTACAPGTTPCCWASWTGEAKPIRLCMCTGRRRTLESHAADAAGGRLIRFREWRNRRRAPVGSSWPFIGAGYGIYASPCSLT